MLYRYLVFLFIVSGTTLQSQQVALPPDFRQHNLTEFNSSLLSPVFAMDRNDPESIALWSRWQWQSLDADPTTLFFNYTRRLNVESTAGAGYFQHNTGTFLLTGGVLNYAYALELESEAQIAFGLNLFAFSRKLADDRFRPDPDIGLPALADDSNFILQLAPSLRFKLDRFSVGIVAENLFDYNFTTREKDTAPTKKTYIGLASYHFPISFLGSSSTFLQPTVYLKTMPDFDNQIGITTLLSAPRFWVQAGYNNFYGVSGGVGGRFFKRLSLGALVEYDTDPLLEGMDPSFEIITAYSFGQKDGRKKIIGFEVDEGVEELKPADQITDEEQPDAAAEQEEALAENRRNELQKAADSVAAVKAREAALAEQVKLDSIATVQREAALEAARKAALDSIAREEVAVKPQAGEKYEETRSEDGLEPGYYLIANVFGTKKYFDGFMKTLTDKGLQPKSFYRTVNKYNYVYLERYDTIEEARRARESKFNGRYPDNTWIFRVVRD